MAISKDKIKKPFTKKIKKPKEVRTVDKVPNAHYVKWTAETTKAELELLLELLLSDNKDKPQYILWIDLIENRPYSQQRISEWVRDFPNAVSETKKRIDNILAERVMRGAILGKYNSISSIFYLKARHGWVDNPTEDTDNQDFDYDTKLQSIADNEGITLEELKAREGLS